MRAFLVAGGTVCLDFLKESYNNEKFDLIAGIDGGAEYLYKCGIMPSVLIGDFDTLDDDILAYYRDSDAKVIEYKPQKDETDTELALSFAVDAGCDEIYLYGATGTRIDHVLANIQSLMIPFNNNIKAYIIDLNNRIHYLQKEECFFRELQFGKYVSLVPMTECVTGVTLKGFEYPLNDALLTNDKSLAVSNRIAEEKAWISYKEGVLLMIESKD